MHGELCAEHVVVVISAMIHATALARLAHSSFPRNLLLDVGTQVPDPVTKKAHFDPVLGIVSSQPLHHYRLEARMSMICMASFAAVLGSLWSLHWLRRE